MIFRAFYTGASSEPISLSQTITFIWLGQALLQLLPWNIDKEVEAQVKMRNVAYELVRPYHLYGLWFARSLLFAFSLLSCVAFPFLSSGDVSWAFLLPFLLKRVLSFSFQSAGLATFICDDDLVLTSLFWTVSGEGSSVYCPISPPFFWHISSLASIS